MSNKTTRQHETECTSYTARSKCLGNFKEAYVQVC